MTSIQSEPAPLDIDVVLDPGWLTSALQASFPGAVVERTHVVETLETTARKVRLTVAYADRAGHAALPDALCVKGYFNPAFAKDAATGVHESLFYQRLATVVPIRVPVPRYSGIDPDKHGLVIMDDVKAQGAVFFDQLGFYDLATVHRSLAELALLHGRFWNDAVTEQDSLATKIHRYPAYVPTDVLGELLQGPRGSGFPEGMRDPVRLKAGMSALADRYASKPRTVIHADCHLGNLYADADRRIGFVDWQCYEAGHWSMDIAYHLATALEPSVRADNERALVEYYLGQLAAAGGPPIPMSEAWEDYRASALYGYFLWGMTRRVPPNITEELTQRVGKSALCHSSLEVLGV